MKATANPTMTLIHPRVVELGKALAAFKQAHLQQFLAANAEAEFFATHADPAKWVPRIEAVLNGKPDALRIEHEQTCLRYLCYVLAAEDAQHRLVQTHRRLVTRLHAVLSEPNDIQVRTALDDAPWVDMSPMDFGPVGHYKSKMDLELRRRCYHLLERAFAQLVEEIAKVEALSEYPENPVSDDGNYTPVFPVRFEYRRPWCVKPERFEFGVFAPIAELNRQLDELQGSREMAENQVQALNSEIYRTGMVEHSNTMIDRLHGLQSAFDGRTHETVIRGQQTQLLKRETTRRIARLTLASLVAANEAVFGTLKDAVQETVVAAQRMQSEKGHMIHVEWILVPIMMIDCLRANERLREFGPEFRRLSSICEKDLPTEHEMQGVLQVLKSLG